MSSRLDFDPLSVNVIFLLFQFILSRIRDANNVIESRNFFRFVVYYPQTMLNVFFQFFNVIIAFYLVRITLRQQRPERQSFFGTLLEKADTQFFLTFVLFGFRLYFVVVSADNGGFFGHHRATKRNPHRYVIGLPVELNAAFDHL